MLALTGGSSINRAALAAALAVLVQSLAAPAAARDSEARPTVVSVDAAAERYGALPVRFEPNVGQFDERVEFVARGGGYTLLLTAGETVLSLGAAASDLSQRREGAKAQSLEVVRTRLVGASVRSKGEGVGELEGVTNYFVGNDPSRWRTGIVSFAAVRYAEIYPGVDMVYYGNQHELEYDFVVAPGADPSAIRMQVEGADGMTVDASGDLVMEVGGGELRQRAPAIYQEGPAGRQRVAGGYAVRGDVVAFDVGAYDPTRPLVLDPLIAYSRILDGGFDDSVAEIAVGADGSAYITGYTNSTNFPTVAPFQANNAGGIGDAFVTKLSPSGTSLVYSTYLGGGGYDFGYAIAVGADGSVYVAGSTESTNFPTAAPLQAMLAGGTDAFVTRLAPSGASLVYSTYLGGSVVDIGTGIAVGADGSAYVTGFTESTNFPTAAPLQAMLAGLHDAFVAKIAASGASLVYSTYLGGSAIDSGNEIAVGADGSAYVTGNTISTNFPTAAPIQANHGGGMYDAFVTKLAPSGASLAYSTYLGGSGVDIGYGIAVGGDGSAYLTGQTSSTNFPTAAPFQSMFAGMYDAFVTKIAPSGASLTYSTYLGGDGVDGGYAIAVGVDGSAHVAGFTESLDFPIVAAVQPDHFAASDAFVTKLSASGGSLVYSTYFGNNDQDYGSGIAVDADGSAYLASNSGTDDFGYDVVVTKITLGGATTPGVYVPFTGAWFLRNANAAGPADLVFTYGSGGTAVPLAGDWNGDGRDTVGLYFPATGAFFLKNTNAPGGADLVFTYGAGGAGLVPLSGDWDGDGDDTVGLYAPATGAFFLTNANAPGPADLVFTFGAGGGGLVPIAGDWDGDGDDTVGLYNPSTGGFFLKNANAGGAADLVFTFGAGGQGYVPLAGDWDGDRRDTVGLAAPSTSTFLLRLANAPGAADLVFAYGPGGATPLAGDWNGV
jgi:hypothetical protein